MLAADHVSSAPAGVRGAEIFQGGSEESKYSTRAQKREVKGYFQRPRVSAGPGLAASSGYSRCSHAFASIELQQAGKVEKNCELLVFASFITLMSEVILSAGFHE